jgi:hypothetical protein
MMHERVAKSTAFRCQLGKVLPVRRDRASPAKQGEQQEYIDLFSLSRQSL